MPSLSARKDVGAEHDTEAAQETAAAKIQAVGRGNAARKELRQREEAARAERQQRSQAATRARLPPHAAPRGDEAKATDQTTEETSFALEGALIIAGIEDAFQHAREDTARRMQALWRGWRSRRATRGTLRACVRIQSAFRGHLARASRHAPTDAGSWSTPAAERDLADFATMLQKLEQSVLPGGGDVQPPPGTVALTPPATELRRSAHLMPWLSASTRSTVRRQRPQSAQVLTGSPKGSFRRPQSAQPASVGKLSLDKPRRPRTAAGTPAADL